jgi:hypothetical protein
MMDPGDGPRWHETVSHLVHAHGADADHLIGYAPTLEQAAFALFDTHAALDIAGLRPPDGHAHPQPLAPGWSEARPESYRPFPSSLAAQQDTFFTSPHTFPGPGHTGLPHTGEGPGTFDHDGVVYDSAAAADLRDWPSAVRRKRLARNESLDRPRPAAQVDEALRDYIRQYAETAHARWLARVSFPAAQLRPGTRAARTAGRPVRHVPRAVRGR